MTPKESIHPQVASLVTGHYREGPAYASWRAQGTGDWLLIATLSGGGRFGAEGKEVITGQGDLVLLPSGARHDYGTAPGRDHWELLWTHFHPRPDWAAWLRWPEAAPGLLSLTLDDPALWQTVLGRFADAHALATGTRPSSLRLRETFAMNALEEVLLWCDTRNPQSLFTPLDERVRQAMEYLAGHLAEPVTSEALAQFCGLSPSRLSHLFHAQTGQTPPQFLEGQRLGRARQLLELTSRPVGAIAAEVGYENPFYFTLRFKRATGLSPRDYRKASVSPAASPETDWCTAPDGGAGHPPS